MLYLILNYLSKNQKVKNTNICRDIGTFCMYIDNNAKFWISTLRNYIN
jgi:hypothetical protein